MFLISIRRSRTFILCASVTLCLHSALLPTSRYLNKLQHVCASNVSLYLSNSVIYLYLKALFILSLYKVAGVCHYLFQFRKGWMVSLAVADRLTRSYWSQVIRTLNHAQLFTCLSNKFYIFIFNYIICTSQHEELESWDVPY